jgi:DNA processing protein
MTEDQYLLALSLVENIGAVKAKELVTIVGKAEEVFKLKPVKLSKIEGIGPETIAGIQKFNSWSRIEEEWKFAQKYNIDIIPLTDKRYPQRLLNCYDSPLLLFAKGKADYNVEKIVSIVGTREITNYGKQFTEKLVQDLAAENVTVVSGMAYGVDAVAHKQCLKQKLTTIGVLAHGLDAIYPAEHKNLAKDMVLGSGGLLTEHISKTKADRYNFPRRNRIVAGMADATIVIETATKGGSMITAQLANSYNKDVFALPGKVTDAKSEGCNYLIKNNLAILLTDAKQLLETMGWASKKQNRKPIQKEIFIELTPDEKLITNYLQGKEAVYIDELSKHTSMHLSKLAAVILHLELKGVILQLPGKMYKLS